MIVPRVLLVLVPLMLLATAVAIGQEPGNMALWTGLVIGFEIVGGMLVLIAAWSWRDKPIVRWWLPAVVLVGLAIRLAVLPAGQDLSDDAARYHWDGKSLAHGVNPYLFAPDDPAVARLRVDAIDGRINHPWNRTCYPPLAEGLFAVGYALSPGRLRGIQGLGLAFEVVAWVLLARELALRRRSLSWLLPVAWSPLLVCQGYLPGHVDTLTLPFVVLLIGAVRARHATRAGLWLALACLVKPLPLLLLPAMMRELGFRRSLWSLAVFGAVVLAAYLPFRDAGVRLFSSTWLMATDWSFNGSVSAGLAGMLPGMVARLVSGILTVAGLGLVTWKGRDFASRAVGACLVFVVFTTTLFPWYLVSFLPLLALRPQPALICIVTLVPLADIVVIDHVLHGFWREEAWVRWAQYGPFFALLVAALVRSRKRDIPNSEPS